MTDASDAWKEGTPYEDPDDQAMQELREAVDRVRESLSRLADGMRALPRGAMTNICAEHAATQLVAVGLPEDEARRRVHDCVLVAAAEGRNVAGALKALIRRATLAEPTPEE